MTGRYEHILGFALEHPWAITDGMREIVAGILARRIAGQDTDPAELSALNNRANLPQPKRGGAIAVIPLYGVIAPRMNMLSDISGGTTFELLTAQLHEAVANAEIKTIIFDVDSPGGNVAGATEFAAEVLKARAVKPIIAQAEYLMASAAYWPMACATAIHAAPSAMVGSIGVYAIRDDISEALAQLGVKREVISAGKYKAEGVGGGPLSDDARAHMKALIDRAYGRMATDIANGRGVKAAAIRNGYGEGRCIEAAEAFDLGMVDRVCTLAETLARYSAPAGLAAGARALTEPSQAVTAQEPATVTAQEPCVDVAWQNAIEAALLSLTI